MPVNNKKNNMEAGQEFTPDLVCSSLPHSTRFNPRVNPKSEPAKTEENIQNNEQTKA
ncbi:MAG: hypothetical protein N2Z65_06400 [Clostridiales bacterium]|nr:hypothetical protein [Clostridiales bacterium]